MVLAFAYLRTIPVIINNKTAKQAMFRPLRLPFLTAGKK
jgi:hypothetical protein